jgi:ubiquinone/menaquinone biosynthesis C-methylase UbiE
MSQKEEKHISDSYNTGAKRYCEHWSIPHTFTEVDRQKFCGFLPPKGRILDIGCGPGNDTTYFIEKGYDVTGVDLSEEMVRLASERETRAKFLEMDMRHLSFDDNSFDGIWASFSFLHVKESDAEGTLQQFKRVLCNGGYLCLLVHTNEKTTYKKTQISGLVESNGKPMSTYVQEWKQKELLGLLKKVGFDPCIVRPFNRQGGLYPLLSIIAKVMK